jgi:hypothetical protein
MKCGGKVLIIQGSGKFFKELYSMDLIFDIYMSKGYYIIV